MNAQQETWAGSFGDAYTERNRVDWWARVPFWAHILAETRPQSVLEVGCNAGWNLMAIRALNWGIPITGIDINPKAVRQAQLAGLDVDLRRLEYGPINSDLIFTAGVLIHIAPENLTDAMTKIVGEARRFVLAIEYFSEQEEEIEYRGQKGLLWKRPYGALYEKMGLRLVETGEAQGFNDCRFWLMEKP